MSKSDRQSNPEHLLTNARSGSDSAIARLLELYRPYLTLLARLKIDRSLQARLDDSDLVQDACLAAHRDFSQFRGTTEKELIAWLRKVMARVATNHSRDHRRQRRDVRIERQMQQLLNQSSQTLESALAAPHSSPSTTAVRRERAVLLANALAKLPVDYRDVLVLRELEGKSLADIAQEMDRSVNAIQKLWARATVQLRRLLELEWESL